MLVGRKVVRVDTSFPEKIGKHLACGNIRHDVIRGNSSDVFKRRKEAQIYLVQHGKMSMGNFGPVFEIALDMNRHVALNIAALPVKNPFADKDRKLRREPLTEIDGDLRVDPSALIGRVSL